MGNFLEGCPLANQLRDIYPPGFVASVYSEGLEEVFEFPGLEITLAEHGRKGPPPTVLEQEKPFLAKLMLSREKALDIEKKYETSVQLLSLVSRDSFQNHCFKIW